MAQIPLIIAQYEIEGHRNGPDYKHWAIVAIPRRVMHFSASKRLCGGYYVGTIHSTQVGWLQGKLREVPIQKFNVQWDCQSWVLDALLVVRESAQGIITENIGRAHIQGELDREFERWQYGRATVEDRLFPN
ncbi:hypothetical protein EV361DRAFT_949160 [Lentinula raphanica]|uniref:Uncharacterized protein n=1 Tax=Lentinula raphanica TaxID=153919 RepID=A0AA38U9I9_9AGAR|nr:hypothetical protein F5878DRAFT_664972 [Lentinula raphanica]KAJ3972058.1 hypothetical protein EV361DRAFT_949160 [Lentinula raphanica]